MICFIVGGFAGGRCESVCRQRPTFGLLEKRLATLKRTSRCLMLDKDRRRRFSACIKKILMIGSLTCRRKRRRRRRGWRRKNIDSKCCRTRKFWPLVLLQAGNEKRKIDCGSPATWYVNISAILCLLRRFMHDSISVANEKSTGEKR